MFYKGNLAILGAGLLTGLLSFQATPQTVAKSPAAVSTSDRFRTYQVSDRENRYYGMVWGVDSLSVKLLESGELVRFSYQVLDPSKAKALNEKKSQPFLEDPAANVKLVVPQLEQVGMLRQSSTPEPGKAYWMAFSNKGGVVKHGHRVNIVIGGFRADGLVVD